MMMVPALSSSSTAPLDTTGYVVSAAVSPVTWHGGSHFRPGFWGEGVGVTQALRRVGDTPSPTLGHLHGWQWAGKCCLNKAHTPGRGCLNNRYLSPRVPEAGVRAPGVGRAGPSRGLSPGRVEGRLPPPPCPHVAFTPYWHIPSVPPSSDKDPQFHRMRVHASGLIYSDSLP